MAVAGRALERLYQRRMGWLFGHRLAVITHTGRRSGRVYRTVVFVQDDDPAQAHPAAAVDTSRRYW